MLPTVTKFGQNVSKRPILKLLKFYDHLIIISEVITSVKYVVHPENLFFLKKLFSIIFPGTEREKLVGVIFSKN